jgi:WD40 repeat protein
MVEAKDLIVLGGYTYWVYRTFFKTSRSSITPIIASFIYKIFSTVANLDGDGMGARYYHTATLLPNGKVLVAGGRNFDDGALNTSSLYDFLTDKWTAVTNQNMGARDNHTATLLPNGKVLVAGGRGTFGAALNTSSLYDFLSNTWTTVTNLDGDDMGARGSHTATLLPNGKVLVAGGTDTNANHLNTSSLYDFLTDKWTAVTNQNMGARVGHTATLLPNGKVLVAGGAASADGAINTSSLYDPSTNEWTPVTDQNMGARTAHTATLLPNGKVLVAGGFGSDGATLNTSSLYDFLTDKWTAVTNQNMGARADHTATLLPNGKVLVAGGYDSDGVALNTSSLYDFLSNTWTAVTNQDGMGARGNHTATLLPNGKVLVAGGYDAVGVVADGAVLNTSSLYNPAQGNDPDSWTVVTNQNMGARFDHTATLLPNGKVLVAGGYGGEAALNTSSLYTPAQGNDPGSWTAVTNLDGARTGHTATLLPNGKVLVAGGFAAADGGVLNTSSLYTSAPGNDPGSWTAVTDQNDMGARYGHTATLLPNGKVLVAGGRGGAGDTVLNTSSLYDFLTDKWTAVTDQNMGERTGHTATLLPNGKVLVAGGNAGGFAAPVDLNTSSLYDPSTDKWTAVTNLDGARTGHTATLLPNGKVLVAGGEAGDVLNTSSLYTSAPGNDPGSWTAVTDQNDMGARYNHTATLLPNGKVLVAGGRFDGGVALNTSSLYDFLTDKWTAVTDQNDMGARYGHTATLLPNGKVLVAGGAGGATAAGLNTSSLYDPNVYSVVVFPVFSNGTGTINGTNVTTNVEFEIKDPSSTQTLIVTGITGNVAELIAT